MRALVTGGAGFLGSVLVDRLLAEGHAVDVVDDLSTGRLANLADARADRAAELRIHQADVRSPDVVELIARRDPDVVYHLASVPHDDPAADALATVVGAVHVLEGARLGGTGKVVIAAGAGLYGEPDPDELPVRESQPHRPVSAHGAADAAVLGYLRLYRERHGVEFTAVVLPSVYGRRQRPGDGVVATFAAAVLDGRPVEVHGTGAQTRDFLYVDDAVDALVRAGERGDGLVVNAGRGVETSVRDLLALIVEAAGAEASAPAPVVTPGRHGAVRRQALDAARARIHLGWSPWTSLGEGVAHTLRWHADHPA